MGRRTGYLRTGSGTGGPQPYQWKAVRHSLKGVVLTWAQLQNSKAGPALAQMTLKILSPLRSLPLGSQCQGASPSSCVAAAVTEAEALISNCSTDTWTQSWKPAGGEGIGRDEGHDWGVLKFWSHAPPDTLHEALVELCLFQRVLRDGSSSFGPVEISYPLDSLLTPLPPSLLFRPPQHPQ